MINLIITCTFLTILLPFLCPNHLITFFGTQMAQESVIYCSVKKNLLSVLLLHKVKYFLLV